jgi:hypothetical protein
MISMMGKFVVFGCSHKNNLGLNVLIVKLEFHALWFDVGGGGCAPTQG